MHRRRVSVPTPSLLATARALVLAWLLASCGGADQPVSPPPAVRDLTLPAALQLVAGDGQSGFEAATAPIRPSVRIVTAAGLPVRGATVRFTPGTGSGEVTDGVVPTDSNGVATVGEWTFGPAASQTLVATVDGLPGRAFTFRAQVSSSRFGIAVRFIGEGGTDAQRAAFSRAATRWARVVVGDLGTTPLAAPAGECATWIPAIDEPVRNLLVFVRIAAIDGPARIVGRASPCYVNSATRLPIMGFFELDQDDLALMNDAGLLDDVVLHEMGHVLGIGTLWNYGRTLLTGSGSDDPVFTGLAARAAFAELGGVRYLGTPVPVENTGGSGTQDAHWRRSVFGRELMQGYAQPGGMPLSRVTAASLQDLGYTISLAAVDQFQLPLPGLQLDSNHAAGGLALGQDIAPAPLFEVQRDGTRRRLRPPPR